MNAKELIENEFYVRLTGTDEEKRATAIEVIDRAVAAGAELRDGVYDVHDSMLKLSAPNWRYVGVGYASKTMFYDTRDSFGHNATELTLQQMRDVFAQTRVEFPTTSNKARSYEEIPVVSTDTSDGSTASYYELPPNATELQDLIIYRNMNAQDGEIFRAIYRKGRASHSGELRDAKKVLFYAQAEVARFEKYAKVSE